jgi:hypothetical protein
MRIVSSIIKTALGLAIVTSSASAANHYIRAGATGAANGSSWTDAWTSLPSSYVRGDTYYVAGGTYGSGGTFSTAASGTTLITIKKATVADHGTATGWQDTYGTTQAAFSGEFVFLSDYWLIDGAGRTGWKTGYGFKMTHDGFGVEFGQGSGVNNIAIQYVEFFGHGPDGAPYPNNTTFYGIYGGTTMRFSYIYSHYIGDKFFQLCNYTDATIENSWFESNESTAAQHAEGIYHTGANHMVVRNNVWVDVAGTGVIVWSGSNCEVYGNLIYWSGAGDIGNGAITTWSAYTVTGAYIYNNTIIVPPSGGYAFGITFPGTGTGIVARNNLFYGSVSRDVVTWANVDHDYSWFYNAGSQSEAHAQMGTGSPFVDFANTNYNLAAHTSPGVNLGSPYNVDLNGNTRVTWDRGATEFGSTGGSTNPAIAVTPASLNYGVMPTGTTSDKAFTVQNSGFGTLSGSATVPSPYSIVSGGSYNLAAGQSQTVTVRFSPTAVGTNSQNVNFSGASGALMPVTGVATNANYTPSVNPIVQNATDVDLAVAGMQVYQGTTVQYSGSASDPNSLPLTWQWIYTINGGAEVVYQNGSGTVTPVSYLYPSGSAGSTYVWILRVSNGTSSAQSSTTVGVESAPVAPGTLTFEAESGILTAPFAAVNGGTNTYITQTVDGTITTGGQAIYNFTITNTATANYVIQALVNAPALTANSFWVNIDAQPTDPDMAWDILPITSGFEQRLVSGRGNGTADADQFVPRIFTLAPGAHQLIIVGREAGTQLDRLSIIKLPPAPQNLRVTAGL